MEKFKSILPFIIIALVFGIGGYLLGRTANLSDQGASLFTKTKTIVNPYYSWDNGLKACFEYRDGPNSQPYLVAPEKCGHLSPTRANTPAPVKASSQTTSGN